MDKTMGILRAPLWCVLAAVGLSMASLMEYIPLEGRLEIPLKSNSNITTVALWKHLPSGQTLVAEWDWSTPAKDKVYDGTYEGRTELDKETRVIVIRNMTKEDNGIYYIVVDEKNPGDKHYNVTVIKNVPKPSVVYRPPCAPPNTTCSLVCEGNITDSGPVTYRWKKGEGNWMESGQNWTITDDEKWKKVEKVFCEMKNPFSVKQSDPFYLKGNTPGHGIIYIAWIIVGIIVALILIGLVGLAVKYRNHIKGMLLTSCGSDSELVEVPEDASSPRDEKEVGLPLLSTSDKNNHDSTNVMDLIDSIIAKTTSLYVLCEEVKGNKKQCQRLSQRVKGLEGLVGEIKQKGADQNSADVEADLRDLNKTLESAEDVVKKYISDSFHKHVFKDYNDNSEFRSLNSSLNSAFNKLSKPLQVDHKLFNEDSQQAEDEADRKEDHEELKRIMDLIDPILDKATSLYVLCEEVKGNKKQCQRLVKRVKGLEQLVGAIKQKGAGQNSDDVEEALRDLNETLKSAKDVKKYIYDNFHEHVFKDYNDNSEFRSLNSSLNSALNKLSKALQVDHDHILDKLFDKAAEQAEDEADRNEDHADLKRIMDLIDPILDKAASLSPLREGAVRNQERRQCLVERVEVLEERLGAIKQKGPGQNSADVEEALCELKTTLESDEVTKFVKTYTSDVLCTGYGNEFVSLNKCLGNALNKLSSALPDYQIHKLFEEDP